MNKIPGKIFGSCIEDVNHEIYGGLYSQLLYGESFEEPGDSNKNNATVSRAWDPVISNAQGSFMLDSTSAYNGRQAQIIQYTNGSGKIGVSNSGLNRWGIAVKADEALQGRIYLRSEAFNGPVTVTLESMDGTVTYATSVFNHISSDWQKYSFSLQPNATDTHARFSVYIESKGKLWLDQAVLMPTGTRQFKNLPIRADIAARMQGEGINFLRYGGSMVNAPGYSWKNMTGDPDKRPPYKGWWHPFTSNGFGIAEFVQFCNAAGFEAAVAVNIEESPEAIAAMVDSINGRDHARPARLRFIEIGNEEVIAADDPAGYKHYSDRFSLLYDAIHARDPRIQVICSAWWRSKSANMETVFRAINGKAAYWDLHTSADAARSGETVDQTLTKMQKLFLTWDPKTNMKITIFEENGSKHDLERALGHATTLNAVRRHGDFLLTSCPANALQPYKQNDNDWDQGQIFFTSSQVWGMPPFYAQQMAAKNAQPLRIFSSVEGDLDVTATRSEKADALVIHIVNPTAVETNAAIDLKGFSNAAPAITVYCLSGKPGDENTADQPEKIVTRKKSIPFNGNTLRYLLPANSYTIFRYERKVK